jgi:hypothetical protein
VDPEGWSLYEGGYLLARPIYRLEQGLYECCAGLHKSIPPIW